MASMLPNRWWSMESDDAAREVVAICRGLADADGRKSRWDRALKMYAGNLTLKDLESALDVDLYNVSRSAVDTAQAEIAARQRPKPMFLTSAANWKTKRKAKKLDRFVEANLHQRQGRYADAWELMEDVFRAATIAIGGVAKVSADIENERVRIENVPAYEILVDPEEAESGDPQNWFHVYTMDLDLAIQTFCDDVPEPDDGEDEATTESRSKSDRIRRMLESAVDMETRRTAKAFTVAQKVKIYEAWRLPFSSEKPGKHVFACEKGLLYEEDWEWPTPPFVILVWSRDMYALWGTGLVEEGREQHEKINEMAERYHDRIRLCSHRRTYYEPAATKTEDLQSNDSETLIPCLDLSKIPRTDQTPPLSPSEVQLLEAEIQRYYDLRGISQMSASSRKEAGVDAAVAMQTLNDIKSVRFLPKARAYELAFVRLGELIVRAARDIAIEKPKLIARWPGKRFLQEIPWKEVSLSEDMYEVRVTPVSAMSRDPAQRLQIAEQLAASGRIPQDKYFELLNLPDLDSVLQAETAESQWLERLMDRYLDADDAQALEKAGGYEAPDGLFAKPMVDLISVQQMYFQAKIDNAPRYNLSLLERYMRELEAMINKPKPAPAGAPATMPAGAPPMAGAAPPPGAMPAPPMAA